MAKVFLFLLSVSLLGVVFSHSDHGLSGYTDYSYKPPYLGFSSYFHQPSYKAPFAYAKPHTPKKTHQATASCVGAFFCGLQGNYEECVTISAVCNGKKDCRNGVDERHCPPRCTDGMLCNDGRTCAVPCDGTPECPTGEDERCPDSCFCGEGLFRCKNEHVCLPPNKICNGFNDCLDGSDEQHCPAACNCRNGHYLCLGGGPCILPTTFCNDLNACPQGDDEEFCPSNCYCDEGEYICRTVGDVEAVCIEESLLCDGTPDCELEDDEEFCD